MYHVTYICSLSNSLRFQYLNAKLDKFNLEIRHHFLAVRVIKHWKSLPKEEVYSPWLGVFKMRLDISLKDMI